MSSPTQSVKAKLRIILMADTVTVAEVENPSLWQRILSEMDGCGTSVIELSKPSAPVLPTDALEVGTDQQNGATAIDRFSRRLQIDRTQTQGAISPTTMAPYLTLDVHCWEKMKKQLSATGGGAIAALAVAGTLLALWCREAGLETPTQSQAQAVLQTLGIRDKNASRAIRNTSWLQSRPGGQILINPAENSKGLLLAKCFCTGDWSEWRKQQPVSPAR
jgi:hypothetical protein